MFAILAFGLKNLEFIVPIFHIYEKIASGFKGYKNYLLLIFFKIKSETLTNILSGINDTIMA